MESPLIRWNPWRLRHADRLNTATSRRSSDDSRAMRSILRRACPLLIIAMLALLAALALPRTAHADNTWVGRTGSGPSDYSKWELDTNWQYGPHYPSTNAGVLTFGTSDYYPVMCTNDVSGITGVNITSNLYTIMGPGTFTFNNNATINVQCAGGRTVDLIDNLAAQGNLTVNVATTDSSLLTLQLNSSTVNTITLNNSGTLTLNASSSHDAILVESRIIGTGSLITQGSGVVTLNAASTYSGSTEVQAGTLNLNCASALPSTTALTIDAGGAVTTNYAQTVKSLAGGGSLSLGGANTTFTVNGSSSTTFSGTITGVSGAGDSLVKSGSSTLTLSGSVSNVALAVNGGTLILTGGTTYGASTQTTVGSGGTLQIGDGTTNGSLTSSSILDNGGLVYNVAASSTVDYSGSISGSGTMTKNGAGGLTLGGYIGGIDATVNAGTLTFTGTVDTVGLTVSSAGTANLNSGGIDQLSKLSGSGTVNLTGSTIVSAASACDFSGTLNGSGATLIQDGAGTLTLSGVVNDLSLYTDTTVRFSGSGSKTLALLGGLNGGVTLSNATLTIDSTSTGPYGFGGTLTAESGTTGTLVKETSGAAIISGTVSSVALIVNSGSVTFADPWFYPGTHPKSITSLSGTGGSVTINGTTLTIDTATGTDATYAGDVTGSGTTHSLVKSGVGAQTLSGATSDLGINVNQGTLTLSGTVSNVAATVTSGTLAFSGAGSKSLASLSGTGGTVQLANAATLTVNNASDCTYSGSVTGSGSTTSLVKDGLGTLTLGGAVSNLAVGVNAGTLTFSGSGTKSITSLSGSGGTVSLSDATLTITTTSANSFSGNLTGSGTTHSLIKEGASTLTLGGYVGTIDATVNAGTVTFSGTVDTVGLTVSSAGTANLNGSGIHQLSKLSGSGTVNLGGDAVVSAASACDFSGTIDGNGHSLAQSGAGTLTLSGEVNDLALYTDTTVRFSGTGSKTLSLLGGLNGSVVLSNATLTIDSTSTGVSGFGGTLTAESGTTGTLIKETSGAATISGTVSNVALVVNSGSVIFSDPSSSTSKSITSLSGSGGSVTVDRTTLTIDTASGTNATYAGNVNSVTGTLVKSGAGSQTFTGTVSDVTLNAAGGTLTLAGAVSNVALVTSGGTAVFDGVAAKTIASLSGSSGAVRLANAATLTVNDSSDCTFSGAFSGGGTTTCLVQDGGGMLTLGGAVSNLAAVVNSGILSCSGTVSNVAATVNSGMLTFGGAVSNVAATVHSSGTMRFTGVDTKSLSSLSGSGGVALGSGVTLTVANTSDCAFSGTLDTISGTGALVKSGSGSLVLSGTVTNTNLEVAAGSLHFNGTASGGTMTVDNGGTLYGTGTLATLINSGTLAPGNSIGTMTLTGDYTNVGTLVIEINDTESDRLQVASTAHLGGALFVHGVGSTFHVGRSYTFLTAGSVSGRFSDVSDDLAFLDAVLLYAGNTVAIELVYAENFVDVGNTDNQRSVGAYLDRQRTGATGDFATVINELYTLSAPAARAAFDSMSGELHGSLSTVGIENTESFLTGLARRIRSQSMTRGMHFDTASAQWNDSLLLVSRHQSWLREAATGWTPWGEGFGVSGRLASNGDSSGLNYSTGGLSLGMEKWLDEDLLVGVAGGYSNTYTLLDARSDHGTIDAGHLAVYLQHEFDTRYLTGMVSYGYNAYDTLRHVTIGSLSRTADAAYGGNSFSFYSELGRNFRGRYVHLQPYAALEYIQLHQNGFTETGADSMDLSVSGQQADAFRGLLGSRVLSYFRTDAGQLITLEGRAAWRHEFLTENRILDATFAGQGGTPMAIFGENVDRDAAILGTGLSYDLTKSLKLSANYDLLLSTNYTAHAGAGTVEFGW